MAMYSTRKMKKNENDDKGSFGVIETSTENLIASFETKEEAVSLKAKLNGGSGFRGFTPTFFLREGLKTEKL